MSMKISALPTVAHVLNADLVTGVQAGANYKSTRPQLLTAAPGEAIELLSGGSGFLLDSTSNIEIVIAAGQTMAIIQNVTALLDVDAGGGITFTPTGKFLVDGIVAGSALGVDAAGLASLLSVGGVSSRVTYVSSSPAFWLAAPPIDMATAINRIASAVVVLRGGVGIP